LLPVSSGFHFYTHAFRSLTRVLYALPIAHDTSSKNAKLSSATTSFPRRHTNNSKNNGYNAVADDSCRTRNCRLIGHFRNVTLTAARITDVTLSRMTCAGSHFVPRIRHSFPTKKVKKVIHFRTIHTLLSLPDQGGDVCDVWLKSVQKCKFVQGTNKQTFSFIYKWYVKYQQYQQLHVSASMLAIVRLYTTYQVTIQYAWYTLRGGGGWTRSRLQYWVA